MHHIQWAPGLECITTEPYIHGDVSVKMEIKAALLDIARLTNLGSVFSS